MTTLSRAAPAAAVRWPDLADELDRWGERGRVATLWWRDDDAAAPCARLDRLLGIAGKVPVALAVIPAAAAAGLAMRLARPPPLAAAPPVAVLQHGWSHTNHAGGGKKSEFPPQRTSEAVARDLAAGRARLTALFGACALAVLAPPWNRFDEAFLPLLRAAGIAAISRAAPRRAAWPGWPAAGVYEADIHVDLVAWAENCGFIGEAAALGGLVGHLRARRCGAADGAEPTGILTHHLVQDEATEGFLGRLLAVTGTHPAARWLDAGEVFAPAFAAGELPAGELPARDISAAETAGRA